MLQSASAPVEVWIAIFTSVVALIVGGAGFIVGVKAIGERRQTGEREEVMRLLRWSLERACLVPSHERDARMGIKVLANLRLWPLSNRHDKKLMADVVRFVIAEVEADRRKAREEGREPDAAADYYYEDPAEPDQSPADGEDPPA